MFGRFLLRALATGALLSTSLVAGDYDHILDVVKLSWPERGKGMAICALDANQFVLLDLVESAKDRGLSLVIVNFKERRDLEPTLRQALGRRPDFILIIDEDPLMGTKSPDLKILVGRAASMGIPSVGLSAKPLTFGAALAVGSAPEAKVLCNEEVLKRLKLARPDGAVDGLKAP